MSAHIDTLQKEGWLMMFYLKKRLVVMVTWCLAPLYLWRIIATCGVVNMPNYHRALRDGNFFMESQKQENFVYFCSVESLPLWPALMSRLLCFFFFYYSFLLGLMVTVHWRIFKYDLNLYYLRICFVMERVS